MTVDANVQQGFAMWLTAPASQSFYRATMALWTGDYIQRYPHSAERSQLRLRPVDLGFYKPLLNL